MVAPPWGQEMDYNLMHKDGEGPSVTAVSHRGQFGGARDVRPYAAEDVRFTAKGDLLYAFVMAWPEGGKATIKTLADGVKNWTFRGLAYDSTKDFVRHTDGTVNHWDKIERPGVLIENGHVTHFSFAVLDVPKNEERGNDTHGSKIIVVPFDGAALDRDLQTLSNAVDKAEK